MTPTIRITPVSKDRLSDPGFSACGFQVIPGHGLQGEFWRNVAGRLGTIGFNAERESGVEDGKFFHLGHVVFYPKTDARRLCYPTCPTNKDLDKTLYLHCTFGSPDEEGRLYVGKLMDEVKAFARERGIRRIEACNAGSPVIHANHSVLESFGFAVDPSTKQALSAKGLQEIRMLFWEDGAV